MKPPALDQVSSQALIRLAAERGLTPTVEPAGEDAVPKPRRSWKRFLPYFFLALSIFALGGMVLGVVSLADEGWSVSDAVQLILMALLVFGVFQQARSMLRPTRFGRLISRRKKIADVTDSATPLPAPVWDAVSAEDLAADRPAAIAAAQLGKRARRHGSRWAERFAIVSVVLLALLAFLGMLFLCGYIAYAAGPWDPGLWLTIPFTALTGFGSYQVFRSARRSAFRGRPLSLVSRAFRDSVHVWGTGSLVTNVLLTSTATASIAGAAITPIVTSTGSPLDLFLIDAPSGELYRVDLATNTSARVAIETQFAPVALGTTDASILDESGKKLPRGSLITIFETERGAVQAIVGFAPGSKKPVTLARIQPRVPGAWFTGGAGKLYALQRDGTFSAIDAKTGVSTRVAKLTVTLGPITYDADTKAVLMLAAGVITKIDPTTGTVLTSRNAGTPAGFEACGISLGTRGKLWIAEAVTGRVFSVDPGSATIRPLSPLGEIPAQPCALTIAYRK